MDVVPLFFAAGVKTNISGKAFVLGILSILAGVFLAGPIAGVAIVVGIAIHEYGHVAAYRVAGHDDARFRMIPFLGGVAISERMPRDQLTDFYVVIMGPGIMLAPLAVFGVLSEILATDYPMLANISNIMFIFTGAINFFNLLPLWPLDGGRIIRTITYSFSPMVSRFVTLGMSLALGAWAIYMQLPLILIVAVVGFNSARRVAAINKLQPAMERSEAIMAAVAYLATMAAHGMAGQLLIERFVM